MELVLAQVVGRMSAVFALLFLFRVAFAIVFHAVDQGAKPKKSHERAFVASLCR
jgi:hypothetical protein